MSGARHVCFKLKREQQVMKMVRKYINLVVWLGSIQCVIATKEAQKETPIKALLLAGETYFYEDAVDKFVCGDCAVKRCGACEEI